MAEWRPFPVWEVLLALSLEITKSQCYIWIWQKKESWKLGLGGRDGPFECPVQRTFLNQISVMCGKQSGLGEENCVGLPRLEVGWEVPEWEAGWDCRPQSHQEMAARFVGLQTTHRATGIQCYQASAYQSPFIMMTTVCLEWFGKTRRLAGAPTMKTWMKYEMSTKNDPSSRVPGYLTHFWNSCKRQKRTSSHMSPGFPFFFWSQHRLRLA